MNTNDSTRAIELSIKLIEQPTKSVLLPQNATVLELKNEIQSLYDIDSLRQRLIFQGKVLKDDKNLLDYENLGDGKVIHLVTRPISSSSSGSRRSAFHRTTPTRRPQILREEDGLTAEYTVLTLNATTTRLPRLRDMRSDLLDRLVPSVSLRNNPLSPPSRSLFSSRPSILQTLTSHPPSMPPFEFLRTWLTSERRNDQHEDVLSFPIPSSLDMRLSRTLAYIIEIKSLLNSSMNTPNEHPMRHLPRPTPFPAIQEARRLLSRQPNISAKTEFIVSEMTDIYDTLVPFLQSIAAHLGSSYSLADSQQHQLFCIQRVSRIVQLLSLANHFLGHILSNHQLEGNSSSREVSATDSHQTVSHSSESRRKRKRNSNSEQSDNNNDSCSSRDKRHRL